MEYNLFTDEILSRLLRTGDTKAYHEIYQRYWRKLYTTALRKIGTKEIAEEIIQDIFETLWEKHSIFIIENLENYLFTAVKYGVIRYYKSQFVEEKYLTFAKNSTAEEFTTDSRLSLNELNDTIEKALSTLPEKTQRIFRMSRFEHLSIKEIAEKLDLSDKAVEYHITQALKSLRLSLRDFLPILFLFCNV